MSPLENNGDAPVRLLPHQVAFVEAFLGAGSKRITLLRGDVGLGKNTALAALATRLLREQPLARSLFLVPAALRAQFVETLRNLGTPALLVDRYKFRELLESASDHDLWPCGVVSVLSREFARQIDILESLASTHWDLVIADEAQSFSGAQAELLRRVGAAAKRIVLATASNISSPDWAPIGDVAVVSWDREHLVDFNGKPLDVAPRPVLHEAPFDLSRTENSLVRTVTEVRRLLETMSPQQDWLAKSLVGSLRSSPAALEAMFQRLADASVTRDDSQAEPDDGEEEEGRIEYPWSIDRIAAEKLAGLVGQSLRDIGEGRLDSKADAFLELLSRIIESKGAAKICVLTNFVQTAFYLAAEIESRGQNCEILHAGMSLEDRFASAREFAMTGAIMIATRAVATSGIDLSNVTDLVLYDIPSSKNALAQTLGRFDRIGRQSQLNVHVLVPSQSEDAVSSDALGILRQAIRPAAEA